MPSLEDLAPEQQHALRSAAVNLHREFEGIFGTETIEQFLATSYDQFAANATVVTSAFHRFQPHGVSGVVVIQESHLSIHTWPETGYAALDFYTCGDHTDPWAACEYAAEALDAKTLLTTEVKRGVEAGAGRFTHVVTTEVDTRELAATA